MKRNLFAVVLSLILALTIPMTSLAATEVTFGVELGNALLNEMPENMKAPVQDLLNVLSFTVLNSDDGKNGLLSVNISGESALDFAVRMEDNGMYLDTALLGDKPLYFTRDDLVNFLTGIMQDTDASIGRAEVEEMVDSLFASAGSFVAMPAMDANAEPVDFTFDKDAVLAEISNLYPDDVAMQTYVTNIINKTVVEEGSYTAEGRDDANVCITMTIASEDIIVLLDSPMLQESLAQTAAANNMKPEEMIAETREVLENMDMNCVIHIYLVKEGSQIVGMDMHMQMKDDDDNIEMIMTMGRLTTDVTTYTIALAGAENGTPAIGGDLVLVDDNNGKITAEGVLYSANEDGSVEEKVMMLKGEFITVEEMVTGWMSMVSAGDEVAFQIAAQPTNDGDNMSIALFMREDAAAPLAPAASDDPVLVLNMALKQNVSEDKFAAINAATPETSVCLAQMSDTEAQEFLNGISGNMTGVLLGLISKLPPSVLSLFMNMN